MGKDDKADSAGNKQRRAGKWNPVAVAEAPWNDFRNHLKAELQETPQPAGHQCTPQGAEVLGGCMLTGLKPVGPGGLVTEKQVIRKTEELATTTSTPTDRVGPKKEDMSP